MEPIEELRQRVSELETIVDHLRQPNAFVVLALFKFPDVGRSELPKLPVGKHSGLPTIKYNWVCDPGPCRGIGNSHWLKGLDGAGNVPKTWAWTHVGSRTFPTAHEANEWLARSEEGQFITKNAEVVMTLTVSDYTRL
jgi:hypothetical protein